MREGNVTVKSHSVSHAQANEYTNTAKWCTILFGSVTLTKHWLKNRTFQDKTMCQEGYIMPAFHFSKRLNDHVARREKQ